MAEKLCPSCNTPTLEDTSQGTVCKTCGLVVEARENIVSEIQFGEGPSGTHHTLGQMVGASGSIRGLSRSGGGYRRGVDSRTSTIENGRRKISNLANRFKLGPHHIESAVRLFRVAVEHNFTQGRRSETVVASCLYIVCRRDSIHLLLIDFADELNIDVYSLGQTFLQFSKLCDIELKPIDPSLYLHRFASELQFEEKSTAVVNTALRLIQRMNRDWIQTGRRPSGICGATLLIAARLHGFDRTTEQIVKVVRVCEMTLRRRLDEFKKTPTSSLTIEQFESTPSALDIDAPSCDPPSFDSGQKAVVIAQEEADKEEWRELDRMQEELDENNLNWEWNPIENDDFGDISDDQIEEYINTPEEQKVKTQLWEEMHRDYLLDQKRRQEARAKEEERQRQKKKEREMPKSGDEMTKDIINSRLKSFNKMRKVELKDEKDSDEEIEL